MDEQLRTRAEARLKDAAAELGLADVRTHYRVRLRRLRESDPDAFGRATRHYEETVLPALVGDDPLAVWLDYGRFLASLETGEAKLTAIDATGRATPLAPRAAVHPRSLLLFLPTDGAAEPLVAAEPLQPSAAQRATLDLLVGRRLALSDD